MQKKLSAIIPLLFLLILASCDDAANGRVELTTNTDSVSYAIGVNIGKDFMKNELEINTEALHLGLSETMMDSARFTDQQVQTILQAFQMAQMTKQAQVEKQAGAAWLAQNKTQPGVQEHPSGLQYKVLKEGTGGSPNPTDEVTINYEGKLTSGQIFDSSYQRGEPISFPLPQLIQAWQIALPMMKKGGTWEIYCSSDLGYGDMGSPGGIPGGATLIFKIDLLNFKAGQPQPEGNPALQGQIGGQ